MFCSQCGHGVTGDARFCSACGSAAGIATASRSSAAALAPTKEPLVVLKPRFEPALALARILPLQLFFTVWCGGFFGGFSMLGLQFLDLPIPPWAPFVFFGGLAFFGIPGLAYRACKRTAERTEYRFFPDRLEYFEGFWNVQEKTISLADVTEVSLSKGVLQSRYRLGTVVLLTPAVVVTRGLPGVRLTNIEEPDEVYQNVRELIENARRGRAANRAA